MSAPQLDSPTHRPEMIANISSTKPISDTSDTRPGRRNRRYMPMNKAMGMVIAIENTPHGLSASALTTTSARTAIRMIMMTNTAIIAAKPPMSPSSSRAIWPRLRPRRRVEIDSTR